MSGVKLSTKATTIITIITITTIIIITITTIIIIITVHRHEDHACSPLSNCLSSFLPQSTARAIAKRTQDCRQASPAHVLDSSPLFTNLYQSSTLLQIAHLHPNDRRVQQLSCADGDVSRRCHVHHVGFTRRIAPGTRIQPSAKFADELPTILYAVTPSLASYHCKMPLARLHAWGARPHPRRASVVPCSPPVVPCCLWYYGYSRSTGDASMPALTSCVWASLRSSGY
ncbi:hypothetical protein CERZMDRAFT_84336 [Cercospora zeae-maydis SCOH1-5]|uniref:Uncharacterized protein n=1 Tax=Cercospora zeae-maydis SCOH1-5 TaxID=717836 RepID=A0A6A6FGW2_9PEZI|nr:hypothetical protein CERZMDRAFT_84336 [Cercospora zeae-maydis SCOH1-5]